MGGHALEPARVADDSAEAAGVRSRRWPRWRVQAWQAYLAFGALGTLLYMVVDPFKGSGLLINTLGLSSWIAVIVGIRRNKPT